MVQRFISLLVAVALGVLLFLQIESLLLLFSLLTFLIIVLAAVNFSTYKKEVAKFADLTYLLLPTFWVLVSAAVAFLAPSRFWLLAAAVFSASGLLKLQLNLRPKSTTATLDVLLFLSVIGSFTSIWALDFYFTPGWWIIMSLVAVCSFLFFWIGFYATLVSDREKLIASLILSFLFAEIAWALLFWPLYFFTTALVLSGLYYLAWMITRFHLNRTLSREKLIVHVVFVCLLETFLLFTTSWLPQI